MQICCCVSNGLHPSGGSFDKSSLYLTPRPVRNSYGRGRGGGVVMSSSFIIARRPRNIFQHYDRDFIAMCAFFIRYTTIYKFKTLEKPPFPPCPVDIERRMGIFKKKLMRQTVGVTLPHEHNTKNVKLMFFHRSKAFIFPSYPPLEGE